MVVSCSESSKDIKPVVFDVYNGYFVKNDVTPDNEVLYFISSQYNDFDKYFGMAAIMSKQKWIEDNNLANQMIIAVANKVDNNTESVKIDSVQMQNNTVYIDYTITALKNPTTYTSRHLSVIVAAVRNVKKAIFREAGREVKQIDLK